MSFNIRLMQSDDLIAVTAIQADAYSGYFLESADVITQRFDSSPGTSWIAERDGQVCAYLIGYWSMIGKISPLNAPFTHIKGANCLYLHDLALFKSVQGFGLAKALINAATEYALNEAAQAIALMSVQDSVTFWRKYGFVEFPELDEAQRNNLRTYLAGNEPAFYMVKDL
jgi:GNAT superfamily N-acetyltransferase